MAVGEELEIAGGETSQVQATPDEDEAGRERIVLTNANPVAATAEVEIELDEGEAIRDASAKLGRKDGRPLWRVVLPANGQATLSYRWRGG